MARRHDDVDLDNPLAWRFQSQEPDLGAVFAGSGGRKGPESRKGGSKKGGGQRGGGTTGRKTTARGGKAKSAAARARSFGKRSKAGGTSGASSGSSPSVSRKTSPNRTTNPGPGDVRHEHV